MTPPRGRVLIVDDQEENLDLLEELLADEGYEVSRAGDGAAALRAVDEQAPDCVVLDAMMPVLDGFSVCRVLKGSRRTCFVPVIMLTALSEVTDKVLALNLGADDFLNKPVDQAELAARVRSLVRVRSLRGELDAAQERLAEVVAALDAQRTGRAGRSERVAAGAVRLGRRLGLPERDLEAVARGGLMHDIGLAQLGTTSREAFRIHPEIGERLLAPIPSFDAVREVVRHHHERLDGSGFPDAVRGEAFTRRAEAVALCTAFDDLLCDGLAPEAALARLAEEARRGGFRAEAFEALRENDSVVAIRPGVPVPAWEELLPLPSGALKGEILVAVERRANREALDEILSTAGHRVTFVDSGAGALGAARSASTDLVLLDLQSSDPDGITVCEALRHQPGTELLPVVVVLSWPEPRARLRALEAGADDLLLHPLDSLELIARVKSLLRLRLFVRDLEAYRQVTRSLASAAGLRSPTPPGGSQRLRS